MQIRDFPATVPNPIYPRQYGIKLSGLTEAQLFSGRKFRPVFTDHAKKLFVAASVPFSSWTDDQWTLREERAPQ